MEWWLAIGLSFGLLVAVLMTGLPIFIGFLLLNLTGVFYFFGQSGFGLVANSFYDTATSAALTTIPLFILMGEILFRSGSADILFDSVDRLIGRLRGRLYLFTIILSALLGALSGSAVAVVAMLGRSVLPTMVQRGYDIKLSASVIQGGASLAPIIPPSLLAVIIGSMADVSISSLLIAGIVPGLMLATLSIVYVYFAIWRDPSRAPVDIAEDRTPTGSRVGAIVRVLPFAIIIFSVMGLIILGIATPSESAATGALGALLTAAVYRRLSARMMREALLSTASISAIVLTILVSSVFFGQLLAFTGATSGVVRWVAEAELHPIVMFLLLQIVPFVMCMFIDQIAFMLLAIPIYSPLIEALGFDPVWFWTLFAINLTIGSLTPPFGYTMFALRAAAPDLITLKQVFSASWPITWIFVLGMGIMAIFPGIITWLPRLIK